MRLLADRRSLAFASLLWVCFATLASAYVQAQTAVELPATGQWVDTGIDVAKGDSLRFTPTPALTGRIGTVKFAVSARCVAPATGRLFLRVNPSGYSGEAAMVQVSITHASGTFPASSIVPMRTAKPVASAFVALPNVVGLRFPAAARSLKALGLTARREKRASSRPAGVVLDQSPEAGVDARAISIVTLAVSDGSLGTATAKPVESSPIPLPNYVGMRFPAAARALKDFGLLSRRRTKTSSRPAGVVVGQSPEPGVDARTVRVVTLAVSDGSLVQRLTPTPRSVTPEPVPTTAVHTSIAAAPVTPATAARPPPTSRTSPPPKRATPAPTRTAAVVPSPATRAAKTTSPRATAQSIGTPATAQSIGGPATVAVPSVVGFVQRAAASTVEGSKLRAVYRGAEPSRLASGRVTRTDPAGGARLSPGALVGYWVASGENVVPNLDGQSVDDARALLQKSGFRLGSVVVRGGAKAPVRQQDPHAGALVPVDSAVNVTTGEPRRGWTWWLLAAGALLVIAALGFSIGTRMRAARLTSRLLTVHASLDANGPVAFEGDIRMAGPATHITASVEDGEASFEDGSDIITREEHNG